MIGNAPHERDELLVTGIPPATLPLTRSLTQPLTPPVADPPRDEPEAAPVFVDATGWRARIGRRVGLLAGALIVVFLGALGLGMTTGADVPLTPWSKPSPHPSVKLSRPSVPETGGTGEPSSAAAPRPTGRAGAPAPPAASSHPATPKPTAAASTDRPGRSQASPPAWGHKKKNR